MNAPLASPSTRPHPQYTWWITFLHWFVWLMVLIYLVTGLLHKTRWGLLSAGGTMPCRNVDEAC